MPASEIDDIFASKGTSSAAAPTASSSSTSQAPEKKKRKKDRSAKRKRSDGADAVPPKPAKRKVPETVFDPSAAVGLPSAKEAKTRKADKPATSAAKLAKPKKNREDDDRFKDSRGTGPRRKTEEGFSIFKEDELGITDQGGDTPLCPFDCQCSYGTYRASSVSRL
ncbi:hypothetical protein C2E23DRAFT_891850 [Lenzites betulinus]|nr:hypothetical protein C2E23DRAFT_891850 [Lenzites betulinus]